MIPYCDQTCGSYFTYNSYINSSVYFTSTSYFNVTLGYNYIDLSSSPLFVKAGSMPYMNFDSTTGLVSVDKYNMATYPDVEITSSTNILRLSSSQNWNFHLRSYAVQICRILFLIYSFVLKKLKIC